MHIQRSNSTDLMTMQCILVMTVWGVLQVHFLLLVWCDSVVPVFTVLEYFDCGRSFWLCNFRPQLSQLPNNNHTESTD